MERQSEDGDVRANSTETQRVSEGAAAKGNKKQREKKPYARKNNGQKWIPTASTRSEENVTSSTAAAAAAASAVVATPVTFPSVMLLRLTYWLNRTLNKSVNAGMYGFRHATAFEPCVILASTARKIIVITHDEWKSMLPYFNNVTTCLKNKERKTVFVPGEDCIAFGFAVRLTFGKPCVTLYRLDDDAGEQYSPFSMSESEWNTMVSHVPNINGYLNQLESTSASNNKYVHDSLTSPDRPNATAAAADNNFYDRLAGEVYAFRSLPST